MKNEENVFSLSTSYSEPHIQALFMLESLMLWYLNGVVLLSGSDQLTSNNRLQDYALRTS